MRYVLLTYVPIHKYKNFQPVKLNINYIVTNITEIMHINPVVDKFACST